MVFLSIPPGKSHSIQRPPNVNTSIQYSGQTLLGLSGMQVWKLLYCNKEFRMDKLRRCSYITEQIITDEQPIAWQLFDDNTESR